MQHKFTWVIICILLISAAGRHFKSENKALTKYYVYVPGKHADDKGFYISSIEITNKQYKGFLSDLKAKGEVEKLKRARVDTAQWETIMVYNEPDAFAEHYFQHPAYDGFPVVNVTKDGAMLYCDWLTEKYNRTAKVKVRFALPTEEQWMLAAQGGNPAAVYPWKGDSITYQVKGKWYKQDLANYRHKSRIILDTTKILLRNVEVNFTAPSISYMPNAFGIYNMAGNVAELLADKNYTKGGGWNSTADKLTIASKEEYPDSPGDKIFVGFRPVMMVDGPEK